jgi:hypothetical protein
MKVKMNKRNNYYGKTQLKKYIYRGRKYTKLLTCGKISGDSK